MVAQKIGSLVGKVWEVDQADGVECIGRFLQVRTQLDVDQPLIRGAFVQFPDDGAKWVNFQYEFLPEYCFVCGHLGHPSRIYIEKLEADQDLTESKVEVLHNFSELEAVDDLSGWRLRFGERNLSQGNNSTSSGGRWRHEHSSRLGEPRHLQQGQGLRIGLGLLTKSSDSFNLGLKIEGTMQRHEYRKKNRGGEDNDGCSGEERIPPTLELCPLTYGEGGKKARRHQMLTVDLLQEA
ncbi:unnamed protein product [Prunus armeniaca]